MQLKSETVRAALQRFSEVYTLPEHIETAVKISRMMTIYHEELSKHFTEETFPKAESLAWTKCRRFPCVSDFFQGYDGKPDESPDKDMFRKMGLIA